jgi:hypothetical protein
LLLFFFLVVVVASSVGFARALQGGSFCFLCDLFGGGTWIWRADFCWRKILYSPSGCSFSLWQATTERGFNHLSTKIHGMVPASCDWSLQTLHGQELFLLAVDLWKQLEIAVPCGKMFDLLMFCVAHC